MPRQNRLNNPGSLFHIISRGIERRKIFLTEDDRENFLERLSLGLSKTGYQCYAWALMPNHLHLLLRSGVAPLSDLMRGLMGGYAGSFNRRHKRRGVLFQNRYKSIICQEDAYLLELVRYIHLNPLRAKLVEDIKSLKKFPWTGHSAVCGAIKREFQEVEEVLSLFGEKRKSALSDYIKFISEGVSMGNREDLTGGGLRRSAGGWIGVELLKKQKEYWQGDDRILGDGDFVTKVLKASEEEIEKKEKLLRQGWDLERLSHIVCKTMSVNPNDLREKGRANNLSEAKAAISYLANNDLGKRRKEIADFFKVSKPAITYIIKSGKRAVDIYKLNSLF